MNTPLVPEFVSALEIKRTMNAFIPGSWVAAVAIEYLVDKNQFELTARLPNLGDPTMKSTGKVILFFERDKMEYAVREGLMPMVMRDSMKFVHRKMLEVMLEYQMSILKPDDLKLVEDFLGVAHTKEEDNDNPDSR